MFVNQVNIKDLFSTNPSHLLGSRNTDEDYTQAVETGHENSSQFAFSQNDFNDSQEYSQQPSSLSQSQSQRSDSPNKSHNNNKVKINKIPLSGFTSSSKLSNIYGSLHESKMKAARERDEKESINNLWTAFKENCNENQLALQSLRNDVKQEILENKNLLSTQIEQHVNCLKHQINSLNPKLEPFEGIEKELNNIKQSLNDWCEDQKTNSINKRESDFEKWSSLQKTVEKSIVQLQSDVETQIVNRLDEQTNAINTQLTSVKLVTENHTRQMSEIDLSKEQNLVNKISTLLEEWKRPSESEQTLSTTLDTFKNDILSSFTRQFTEDRLCKDKIIYDRNMKAFFDQLARENQSIQSAQYDQMSAFAVKEHDQIKRLVSSQLNCFLQSFEENINKNLTEIWKKNTQTLFEKFENHKQEINRAIDEKLNTMSASLSEKTYSQRNNDPSLNARNGCNSIVNKGKNSVGNSFRSNSELDTYMQPKSSEIYRNSSAFTQPIERFESTRTVLVSPMLSNPRYNSLDRKNMKITKLCEYNMSPELQQFQKVSTFKNNSELAVSPFTKDIYSNRNQYMSTVKDSWPSNSRTLRSIDQDKENSLVNQSSMPVGSKQTVTLYKNFNQSVMIPPDVTICSATHDVYKFNEVDSSQLETPLRKTYSRNFIAPGNDSRAKKSRKQKTVEKPLRKQKEKVSKKAKSGSKNKYFKCSPLLNNKMGDKSYLEKDGNKHMEVDQQGDGLQSCDSSPGISLSENFINHNNATLTRAMRTYRRSKNDEEINGVPGLIVSSSPADNPSAAKKKKLLQTKSEKRKKPRGRKSK